MFNVFTNSIQLEQAKTRNNYRKKKTNTYLSPHTHMNTDSNMRAMNELKGLNCIIKYSEARQLGLLTFAFT